MPDRTGVVDTHVHFWDLTHPSLRWSWLATGVAHPILGDIEGIKSAAYRPLDLAAESRFSGVASVVHVQAADPGDPVAETRWISQLEGGPAVGALVAHVDLGSSASLDQLDQHGESPLLRGVRDFATERYAASGEQDQHFELTLGELARRGLVLDLDCEWQQMPAAARLAGRHPELPIVLEHIGYPRRRDQEYFQAWRQGITALAAAPNVSCKLSGIAMTDRSFSTASLTPWVEHCLDAFGADRCMVGSNWPVDRIASSYDVIMSLYRGFAATLGADEEHAVLAGNATSFYRL